MNKFVALLLLLAAAPAFAQTEAVKTPAIATAQVRVRDGDPVIEINGEPAFFACHYLRHYQIALGQKWPDGVRDAVRRFAARGVHRFESQVDLGWQGVDGFAPVPGSTRVAPGPSGDVPVDAVMEAILQADPTAQVVLRIGAHNLLPARLQDEFKTRYPDELERDDQGRSYSISFASDVGFEKLSAALGRLVRYAESRPWAGHVAGYTIFLEFEGVPWGSVTEGAFTDYSPAMRTAWRKFLSERYHADAALAKAWGDPRATLADAEVPTPTEHLGGDPRFLFHHPVRGRKVRDYYELMDQLTIRRHQQTARAVKQACGGRKLVGMMGGYSQDAGEPRSIMSPTGFPEVQLHKQHFSGPGCWGRAFDIPEIDYFFAPRDYLNTGLGGVCGPLHMPASLRLHGKVAWIEDDQRTHLDRSGVFNPGLRDARESIMAHQRNAALLYTEAGATDWMEQTRNWLMDDALLDNLGKLNTLLQGSIRTHFDPPDAICVLFDEESQGWSKPVTLLDEELFYLQRNGGLSYCGVPVRFHLLSDLALPNFPQYKCFVLPNAYHWTPEKEKLLAAKAKRDGNVLVWIYGAGYIGERDFSTDAMRTATGIALAADPNPWEHRISIQDFDHPITRRLPGDFSFGTTRHYGPCFRVDDPQARLLGRSYAISMNRQPALAVKSFGRGARGDKEAARGSGDYASLYCEAPNLPAALLREIARYAGCHVYLETNDFLLAGKDLVMLHSAKPGPRTLSLPEPCDVTDWATGKVLARDTRRVELNLENPGTLLLRVSPPKP